MMKVSLTVVFLRLNTLRISPPATTEKMPTKYMEVAASALPLNTAVVKNANKGSFALHGIKGVSIMVLFLSFTFFMVRADIMAGTEQPQPTTIDTKDLPDKPIALHRRSIMNATLDI